MEFVPEDGREVEALPLSTRARTALRAARIRTISQIRALTLPELMEFKHVGRVTAVELVRVFRQQGIALRDEPPGPAPEPSPVVAPGRWQQAPLSALKLPFPVLAALRGQGIYAVGELGRLKPDKLQADLRKTVLAALATHGPLLQDAAAVDASGLPLLESLPPSWTDRPVDVLNLTQRTSNALRRAGIVTVGQLGSLTPAQLLSIRKFGRACLEDVRARCYRSGLFGQPPDEPARTLPSLVELGLSARVLGILGRGSIWTLDHLCAQSAAELSLLPGMGRRALQKVQAALSRVGRSLAADALPATQADGGPAPQPDPVTLDDWTEVLLSRLTPRQREAIVLHVGLYSGRPIRVTQVSVQVGVTPERARQLVRVGLKRIGQFAPAPLAQLVARVTEWVAAAGGLVREADVAAGLTQLYPAGGIDPAGFARFALRLCPDLEAWPDDWWSVDKADPAVYQPVVATLAELLSPGIPLPVSELVAMACARHAGVATRFVEVCLRTSDRFWIMPGDWVLLGAWARTAKSHWPLAALHAIGRPAHYTEVAARLRALVPGMAGIKDGSVHNRLVKLPQVVRTDAGTFALKAWGLSEDIHIVGLLEEALQQRGAPATTEELVQYVLARKACRAISIRAFLEADGRFMALRPGLYGLTRWAVDGDAAEQLAEVRSIPQRPDVLLQVLDRLVADGCMAHAAIGALLAQLGQATRADDHVLYLVRQGWAAMVPDGGLVPTERARHLYASVETAGRLTRFAFSDANFQAYLILLVVEDLMVRGEKRKATARVRAMLEGWLAPLRPIYAVLAARLGERLAHLATADERKMQRLLMLRAPGMPQVFGHWVRKVTCAKPAKVSAVRRWLMTRGGAFPTWPAAVQLGRIRRPATRLLCLAAALAAEGDAAVDYRALVAFAQAQGLVCPALSRLAAELLASGVFVDDRDPEQVRLLSPHELFVRPADVPGGLPGGSDGLLTSLHGGGVLVRRRDLRDASPVVCIHFTAPA